MPWGKREELLESEFEKIEKYKELGHMSNYENALQYLERMELKNLKD